MVFLVQVVCTMCKWVYTSTGARSADNSEIPKHSTENLTLYYKHQYLLIFNQRVSELSRKKCEVYLQGEKKNALGTLYSWGWHFLVYVVIVILLYGISYRFTLKKTSLGSVWQCASKTRMKESYEDKFRRKLRVMQALGYSSLLLMHAAISYNELTNPSLCLKFT